MSTDSVPSASSMTKRDLIDEVIKIYPRFSGRDAEIVVNAVFDSMTEALARGERIEIRGFGSFVVKHRKAREGRNPKTGAVVPVAAKRVPFFKVGKELKLRVDGRTASDSTREASEQA
jgi:integration host factor subunit beta